MIKETLSLSLSVLLCTSTFPLLGHTLEDGSMRPEKEVLNLRRPPSCHLGDCR